MRLFVCWTDNVIIVLKLRLALFVFCFFSATEFKGAKIKDLVQVITMFSVILCIHIFTLLYTCVRACVCACVRACVCEREREIVAVTLHLVFSFSGFLGGSFFYYN